MRCPKHPTDHTSSTGVCASCLQQRLFSLIAAQTPPHAQPDIQSSALPPPQPLLFPESVSPKPDPPEFRSESFLHRFHSTPQARPVAPAKKQQRKFSLLSHLFRSRSAKSDYDNDSSRSAHAGSISSQAADSVRISSSSPSWFQRSRRRGPAVSSLDDSSDSIRWEPFWVPDREEGSPSGSDSSSIRRRMTSESGSAPARPNRTLAHSNGMGLFTNPLVWASPSRYGKQKRGANQETGISGDLASPAQPHITAAAADAKRTRKLTELGRANKKR